MSYHFGRDNPSPYSSPQWGEGRGEGDSLRREMLTHLKKSHKNIYSAKHRTIAAVPLRQAILFDAFVEGENRLEVIEQHTKSVLSASNCIFPVLPLGSGFADEPLAQRLEADGMTGN